MANSFALPQGATFSPMQYSLARQAILQDTNQLITKGTPSFKEFALGYIDNFTCASQCPLQAVQAYCHLEQRISDQGGSLNSKDAHLILTLIDHDKIDPILERIRASLSLQLSQVQFHPDQQGIPETLPRPMCERGIKLMGAPLGSVEFQAHFLAQQYAQIIGTL